MATILLYCTYILAYIAVLWAVNQGMRYTYKLCKVKKDR